MKKIIVSLMMLLMVFALVGCGNSKNKNVYSDLSIFENQENVQSYVFIDEVGSINKINQFLPEQIRVEDGKVILKGYEYEFINNCLISISDNGYKSVAYYYLTTIYND